MPMYVPFSMNKFPILHRLGKLWKRIKMQSKHEHTIDQKCTLVNLNRIGINKVRSCRICEAAFIPSPSVDKLEQNLISVGFGWAKKPKGKTKTKPEGDETKLCFINFPAQTTTTTTVSRNFQENLGQKIYVLTSQFINFDGCSGLV